MKSPNLITNCLLTAVLLAVIGCNPQGASNDNGVLSPSTGNENLSSEVITILNAPDKFYLYSLHPITAQPLAVPPPQLATNSISQTKEFHGYEILGQTEVSDPAQRKELVESFKQGISEGKGPPPTCFNPRHGIRVIKNGTTVDFIICFECKTVKEVIQNERWLYTSASPRDTFNKALKQADLPLAEE